MHQKRPAIWHFLLLLREQYPCHSMSYDVTFLFQTPQKRLTIWHVLLLLREQYLPLLWEQYPCHSQSHRFQTYVIWCDFPFPNTLEKTHYLTVSSFAKGAVVPNYGFRVQGEFFQREVPDETQMAENTLWKQGTLGFNIFAMCFVTIWFVTCSHVTHLFGRIDFFLW